jgi:hypothetical protein
VLQHLASRLVICDPRDPVHPELLILRGSAERTATNTGIDIETRQLRSHDPVAELIGLRAEPSWVGVGVRAPATSRRIDAGEDSACTFVHLLDPQGFSVTHLTVAEAETIELGPDATMREGRIPDACRRMFDLPTAAPPIDMSQFVLDAWLAQVLRAALLSPGLTWHEVVGLSLVHHLGTIATTAATPSPAAMASALGVASRNLDWHRYRSACVALGGCPVSELTSCQIEWMDTGMFARWAQGSLPCSGDLLDLLEPTLEPTAFDRLWATVSLARHDHDTSDR